MIQAEIECSTDGLVFQEEVIAYYFRVPVDIDFNLMVTMDTIHGDPDLLISWPSRQAYEKALISNKLGAGDAVDSVFISKVLLNGNPGLWNVNITSFTPSSNFRLIMYADSSNRTLHQEDAESLSKIMTQCCSGQIPGDMCPLLYKAIIAYQSGQMENDLCHIAGNLCDREGHVTHLDLKNQGMSCKFPTEFGELESLQELKLAYNAISGQINEVTTVLQKSKQLRWLNLASNQLKGTISCQMAFPQLRLLELTDNQITGTIPPCLLKLPNLVELFLSNNKGIIGTFPSLPRNSSLVVLHLNDMQLNGSLPDFSKLPQLMMARVSNNTFSGTIGSVSPTIRLLHLGNNFLTGTIPSSLESALNLEVLELSNNLLTGTFPEFITQLPALEVLEIENNNITGELPQNWTSDVLSQVLLGKNSLQGQIPALMATIMTLHTLSLAFNNLFGNLDQFARLIPDGNSLFSFDIQGNQFTGSLPKELSKLGVFGEDFLQAQTRKLSGVSFDPIPNKFFIQDNKFNGTIPEYLMLSLSKHYNLLVNTTNNFFTCPTAKPIDISIRRMNSINCTSQEQEVSLLAYFTLNPIASIPDKTLPGLKNLSCSATHNQEVVVFVEGMECINTDVVTRNQTHSYGFYVSPNTEFDLMFVLNVLEGEADLYVQGFESADQRMETIEGGSRIKTTTMVLQKSILKLQTGWWFVNISSYAQESIYQLSIEAVGPTITLHQDDKMVLGEIVRDCCKQSACQFLTSAIVAPGNGNIQQDLCFTPPNRCNEDGHIVHLSLDNEGLMCKFPQSLQKLQLQRLSITGNQLNGTLMDVVLGLPGQIAWLDISQNQLAGELNCEIFFPGLDMLSLSQNMINGTLSNCIVEKLSNISTFLIKGNYLWGQLPDFIHSRRSNLRIFTLSAQKGGGFEGPVPDMQWMQNLLFADFSDNKFSGYLPQLPTSLKILRLNDNILTGSIPQEYSLLENMEDVDISNNQLYGVIPKSFVGLPKLERLIASHNKISGQLPNVWSGQLQQIYLQDNLLSGTLTPALASLPKLNILMLSDNYIIGTLYDFSQAIINNSRLMQFDVSYNSLSGDIPSQMEKLGAFSDSYMFSESNPTHSHLKIRTAISNLFNVASNNLTGFVPEYILRVMPQLLLEVNLTDNQIRCPEVISWDLMDKYISFKNIMCLDRKGQEILLTMQLLPPPNFAKLQCTARNYTGLYDIVSSRTEVCIGNGRVSRQDPVWFALYLDGKEKFDLELDLNIFEGGASLLVQWNSSQQSNRKIVYLSEDAGAGESVQYIFISRDILLSHPGWWHIQVFATSTAAIFSLTARPVVQERILSKKENDLLFNIYEACCQSNTCPMLQQIFDELGEVDICHLPPNSCDVQGHITYLSLSQQDMNCQFPEQFSLLQHLKKLDLSSNNISGDLSKVGRILPQSLRWLNLQSNLLHGDISCDIFTSEIRLISLSQNRITGTIPSCFFQHMPKLAELHLDSNFLYGKVDLPNTHALSILKLNSQLGDKRLSGTIPNMESWPYLQLLDLSDNQFTGTVPEMSKNISYLDISNNSLSGTIPDSYDNLLGLHVLQLNINDLKGTIPGAIGSLPHLEILNLAHNQLSGRIPDIWVNQVTESIILSNNSLQGTLPALIAALPRLQTLDVRYNNLSSSVDKFANSLPQENLLKKFLISHNQFLGQLPQDLSKLAAFQEGQNPQNNSVPKSSYIQADERGTSEGIQKVFSIENNSFNDDFPLWLIGVQVPFVTVYMGGNYIWCPDEETVLDILKNYLLKAMETIYLQSLQCIIPGTMEVSNIEQITHSLAIYPHNSSMQMDTLPRINVYGRKDDGLGESMIAVGVVLGVLGIEIIMLTILYGVRYSRKYRMAKFKKHVDEATSP